MKIVSLVLCVALFTSLVAAYSGPYASLTEWYYDGCGNSANNYVYSLYLYRADGSCFTPTGGLYSAYSYTIQVVNSTSVSLTYYYDSTCTSSVYNEVYEIDSCLYYDYLEISIFETMPSNEYWTELNLTGYNGPWETVLSVDYYTSNCQSNTWVDREVSGWPECYSGLNYYCENNQLHYDACTDTATCSSGCTEVYEPLSDACTAGSNAPAYWSYYIDTNANSYQATCGGPAPSPSPSPSASPSAVPNDDSSSDGPSEGVWILLLIIAFLLGIIIGLLVGFAIYSKLSAKKKQAENGYFPLAPYPMPVPMYSPLQQQQ